MNRVILTGRVANNLELRTTTSEKSVCDFNLAVNRPIIRDGETKADFVKCQVWGNQAKNLCKYQSKGSLIAIDGTLRIDTYEKDGKRKYNNYVLVNSIEFLSSKSKEEKSDDIYKEFGEQLEINEDLPF